MVYQIFWGRMGGVRGGGAAKAELSGFCQLLLTCHQEPWGREDDRVEPTVQSVGFSPVFTSVVTEMKHSVEAQNNFCFCP